MAESDEQELGRAFVESLLECGLVRRGDLEECVTKAKLNSSESRQVSVTDILIKDGYLTPYQFKKLRRRVEKLALVCHHCTSKVTVTKKSYRGSVECPACHEEVSVEDGSASFGEALVIDHARKLEDRVLSKILVSQGLLDKAKVKKYLAKASEGYPKRPLDSFLVSLGKIEPEEIRPLRIQRDRLLEKRYPFLDRLKEDVELGRFLVQIGLVSLNQLNQLILEQAELASGGEYRSLRSLLRDGGALTEYQLDVFLPRRFDRLSKRTEVIARRMADTEIESSAEIISSESEVMEEMRSDALIEIELEEPDEEHQELMERKERAKNYDPLALDPGNLLRQFIEKEYGSPSKRHKK